MSLFERSGFERSLMQLPGVSFADQWEARVAKVGGKVFCLLSDRQPLRIVFKCGEDSFDILTALEGIGQPPYFAKRHWVEVQQGAPLSEEELRAYIGRSHALVATRLTRKLRTELGIG
jgi:predicted DNA-binding protein (MmcQ/YjbR family)